MPGIPELLIVLAIVLILFGGSGRIRSLFGELGSGIASFRRGLQDGAEETSGELPAKNDENKA